MQLSPTKQHYLKAMGIVSWQVRPELKKESTSHFFYVAYCEKKGRQWLILSDASTDSENQAKEIRLLSAICQALGFPVLSFECGNDFSAMMMATQFNRDHDFVLLLGKAVIAKFQNDDDQRNSMHTPSQSTLKNTFFIENSLNQMLIQPISKSQVWKNLQPIFQHD